MIFIENRYHRVPAKAIDNGTDKMIFKAKPHRLYLAGEHAEHLFGILRHVD